MIFFRTAKLLFLWILVMLSVAPLRVFAEEIALEVGYLPILSQLPLVVTYANDRLNLKETRLGIYPYNSYTSLEAAMRVGSIDIGCLPVTIALSMAADGYDVLIIGTCAKGGSRLMARKAGGLKILKGGIIGVPGLDSNESLELKRVMDGAGLRYGLDYHPIDVPLSLVLTDMKTDKLDAFYLPEPYGVIAEKEKIAYPVEGQEGKLSGGVKAVLVIRKRTLAAKRKAVEGWLKKLVSACRFIDSDIRETGGSQVSILQEPWCRLNREVVAEALSKRTGDLTFGGFAVEEKEASVYMDLAGQIKLLNKSVLLKEMIQTELMEKANQ